MKANQREAAHCSCICRTEDADKKGGHLAEDAKHPWMQLGHLLWNTKQPCRSFCQV